MHSDDKLTWKPCDMGQVMTIHMSIQSEVTKSSIRKLIHDLASATNAFCFLVDQIGSNAEQHINHIEQRMLEQLSQHAAMNRFWINKLCNSLSKHLN